MAWSWWDGGHSKRVAQAAAWRASARARRDSIPCRYCLERFERCWDELHDHVGEEFICPNCCAELHLAAALGLPRLATKF